MQVPGQVTGQVARQVAGQVTGQVAGQVTGQVAGQVAGLALAESLTTRLCHDMAGLVATLCGTLEMVAEDPGGEAEAAGLASEAARTLAVRLRLYRAAWGGGDMERAPLARLAEGLPNFARLHLDLTAIEVARAAGGLDEQAGRLALCLLLAASAGMPAGGTVRAALAPPGFALIMETSRAVQPSWPAWPGDGALGHAAALAAPMAQLVASAIGWRLETQGARLIARPG